MKHSDIIFDYLINKQIEVAKDNDVSCDSQLKPFKQDYYEIVTDEESKMFGKPKGKYNLLSCPNVLNISSDEEEMCIKLFENTLVNFVGDISSTDRILVVGLGNRHISSDSLGAKVVGKINITIENKLLPKVMAIAPSVMGLTGIETKEIIDGVIDKVKPTHLILIDSLCASSTERLGRSIQVTNTGLCPGAGIGNNRKCIDNKSVKNIFSIGVPLMIYSSTFISSSLEKFGLSYDEILSVMQKAKKSPNNKELLNISKTLKKVVEDDADDMIVSIKDIEETVEVLSNIIAKSINSVLGVV